MSVSTFLHLAVSVIGGGLAYLLGGFDLGLRTLFFLTCCDMVTGVGQALYNGNFSARECAKGIAKKVFMYITVALAVCIDRFLSGVPIREMTITFYIVSEGMSNLENIGKVIEYPAKLKAIFEQLKEEKIE